MTRWYWSSFVRAFRSIVARALQARRIAVGGLDLHNERLRFVRSYAGQTPDYDTQYGQHLPYSGRTEVLGLARRRSVDNALCTYVANRCIHAAPEEQPTRSKNDARRALWILYSKALVNNRQREAHCGGPQLVAAFHGGRRARFAAQEGGDSVRVTGPRRAV